MTGTVTGLLLLSLGVACGLALLASESPDGLEHSMEKLGIAEGGVAVAAPMPEYEAPLALSPVWRRVLAGGAGTLCVFGLGILAGTLLKKAGGKRVAPPNG
jgi:hypothetical protein